MVTETKKRAQSDMAIPPGEILAEELQARHMTQRELASKMERPVQVINEIVNAKKSITAETALQLENVLGPSAEFWLGLQMTYSLAVTRNAAAKRAKPQRG